MPGEPRVPGGWSKRGGPWPPLFVGVKFQGALYGALFFIFCMRLAASTILSREVTRSWHSRRETSDSFWMAVCRNEA